jgi:hypothetical protein
MHCNGYGIGLFFCSYGKMTGAGSLKKGEKPPVSFSGTENAKVTFYVCR